MRGLQIYSQKLGFSIQAKNGPLSDFYLHEFEEAIEEIESVHKHDKMPIGDTAKTIIRPLIEPLKNNIENHSWLRAWEGYESLIEGCNRCHTATEHAFIKILPASGASPYNQDFAPLESASSPSASNR